ncbi:hypothetical protein Tco_0748128 [Tanacetum coccineum]|uniref:Uncharacterized protein n=1 Tax=Tanacetum coccineum TaxID=301880 RepID=A0ABQ4YVH7_9ASTR
MRRDDSLQTPTQGTTCDLGKTNINPTPITHDTRGPSDTISEPDLEDPVMEFVVQNYDRMNAMYKAFTKKLKDGLHQPMCANTEPPVIEPWNSDSDDVHPSKAKEHVFVESDNRGPSNRQATARAPPSPLPLKQG